jgi:hypothetical protein
MRNHNDEISDDESFSAAEEDYRSPGLSQGKSRPNSFVKGHQYPGPLYTNGSVPQQQQQQQQHQLKGDRSTPVPQQVRRRSLYFNII